MLFATTIGVALVAGLINAPPSLSPLPASVPAPDQLSAKNPARSAPLWVSAELVASVEDPITAGLLQPRADLLHRGDGKLRKAPQPSETSGLPAAKEIPAYSLIPRDQCAHFSVPLNLDWPDPKPHATVHDLLEHSIGIFTGTVVGLAPGFLSDLPATLVTVEVESDLRRSDAITDSRLRYIYYPNASFQVRGQTYCATGEQGSYTPQVGDRIFVFAVQPPLDQSDSLFYLPQSALLFGQPSGNLVSTPSMRSDPFLRQARTFHDFKRLTLTALRTMESPPPPKPLFPKDREP